MKKARIFLSALILMAALTACGQQNVTGDSSTSYAPESVDESVEVSSSDTSAMQTTSEDTSAADKAELEWKVPDYSKAVTIDAGEDVSGKLKLVDRSDLFASYQYHGGFYYGWAMVVKDGKVGYVSEDGEERMLYDAPLEAVFSKCDFSWEYPIPVTEKMLAENPDETYMYPDKYYSVSDGFHVPPQEIFDYLNHAFSCSSEGIVPYYKDGLWGYCNLDGKVIVEPAYGFVTAFGTYGIAGTMDFDPTSTSESINVIGDLSQKGYDIFDADGKLVRNLKENVAWIHNYDSGYYLRKSGEPNHYDYELVRISDDTVIAKMPVFRANGPAYFVDRPDYYFMQQGIVNNKDYQNISIHDQTGKIRYINIPTKQYTPQTFIDNSLLFGDQEQAMYAILDENGNAVVEPCFTAWKRRSDMQMDELLVRLANDKIRLINTKGDLSKSEQPAVLTFNYMGDGVYEVIDQNGEPTGQTLTANRSDSNKNWRWSGEWLMQERDWYYVCEEDDGPIHCYQALADK